MIARLQRSFAILLVCLLVIMAAPSAPAAPASSNERGPAQEAMPDGLMSAFLKASSQPFVSSKGGYRAPSGELDFTLDSTGLQTSFSGLAWRIALRAFGREGQMSPLPEAEIAQTDGQLEYRRGALTEWYRATALGVEQGFTICRPPRGKGPLVLHLDLLTDLVGETDADGRGLSFATPDGQTLRYDHLRAWDAEGLPLEAHLRYAPGQVTLQVNDQAAAYPIMIDPLIYSEQKVIASDGSVVREFGGSVALWDNTAVVGAPSSAVGTHSSQGAAYVFTRNGTNWTEQQKLVASDGATFDRFGSSVALYGDTALVGAPQDAIGINNRQGSAYVFTRSGTIWTAQAHLTASDGAAGHSFGWSVALGDGMALVGAVGDNSVYAFVRSGTVWNEQQKLSASVGASSADGFGGSLALEGDTALVGSCYDDVGTGWGQGSVYVFTLSGTTWSEQARLTASDAATGDNFGRSVALWGNTALVGAASDDIGEEADQGSVYVFTRSGTTWTEHAHLTASDGAAGDSFGNSVAIWDDIALVGAIVDSVGANHGQGSAYVFVRNASSWTEQAHVTASDAEANDYFGSSVALWGDTALVGAVYDTVAAEFQQGSAYVFVPSTTTWVEQAHLNATVAVGYDHFGTSVALWEDTALVGAPGDDIGANADQGSAYVFVRSGMAWSQQAHLVASDGASGDAFGHSVALWGDTALIGASGANGYQGSAYVFKGSGETWTEQQKLTASDGEMNDGFGYSVTLWNETALVGAVWDTVGGNDAQGSAYVFVWNDTAWVEQVQLTALDGEEWDYFGYSVALWDQTALVGAQYDDVGENGRQGSVYVFTQNGTSWSNQAHLTASDGAWGDLFGSSVALWGDTALIGASAGNVGVEGNEGSAYVFTQGGTGWSEQAHLTASDGAWGDAFGISVALWGDTALVGANGHDSVYIFVRGGTEWTERERLTPSDGGDNEFGSSVALWGGTALVGSPNDSLTIGTGQGSAYFYDAPPAVTSIARTDPDPTRASSVHFAVTFSEHVTGVDASDFVLSKAGSISGVAVTAVSGSGATYTVAVSTGTGSGMFRLDVPASATIDDLVGNPLSDLPYTSGEIYTVDKAVPTVLAINRLDPSPTHASSVQFAVTFSEDVVGVDASDFLLNASDSISNAGITGVSGSGAAYTITVSTGSGSGALRLDIPAGAAIGDLAGNPLSGLPYTGGETYTMDALPYITSIVRSGRVLTCASSVDFAVSFSENVTGVEIPDFVLATSSISGALVTGVSGSGATYTVTVSTGTGSGTLRLDVPATATITDLTGNSLSGLPYADGESYTVDKAAPTVLAINRTEPSPTHAPTVDFAVTFSEHVTGLDASDFLPRTTGSVSGAAVTGVSGSGTTYTVTVSTGMGGGTLGLSVPVSATIADLAGNPLSGLPYTGGEVYAILYTVHLPLVLRTVS
jgi:hypothetical protein